MLYEFDDRPRWLNRNRSNLLMHSNLAEEHFEKQFKNAVGFLEGVGFYLKSGYLNLAAFTLHQAVETAYNCYLLTLTNYSPASHNLKFLRGLSKGRDHRLSRHLAARSAAIYHLVQHPEWGLRQGTLFETFRGVSEEALTWLQERTAELHKLVETLCREHIEKPEQAAGQAANSSDWGYGVAQSLLYSE